MLRSVKNSGATDAEAEAYAWCLKINPFSEAGNTDHNKVLDSFSRAWDSLPHYDTHFYRYIADLVNIEPPATGQGNAGHASNPWH
jgi:hypothetical protein